MRARTPVRVRAPSAAGFTLVEILLALLILAVGMMGVLALFPLGIDAARSSVESTRAATIARMAKAILFSTTGSGANQASPFERILNDVRRTTNPYYGPWLLPHYDEILDPDADGDTTDNGPPVTVDPNTAEYSWSITVAYPYDEDGQPPYDYVLDWLWQSPDVFIVQVTVYRHYRTTSGQADVEHDKIVLADVSGGHGVESGDYVRYLASDYSGDGFWYRVDEIGEVGGDTTIKLGQKYWGYLSNPSSGDSGADVQFSDKVIGTYTFLVSGQ